MSIFLQNLDYRLFSFFNSFAERSPVADWLFVFAAEYLVFVAVAGLALFILLKPKDRSRQHAVLIALLAAFFGRAVIDSIIRAVFFRPRPFVSGVVRQLVEHNPLEASFPSGHATVMFAIAFALFWADKRFAIGYLILALISSLSRVVVGVHFPADIAGGALVGLFSAVAAKRLVSFWFSKRRKKEELRR